MGSTTRPGSCVDRAGEQPPPVRVGLDELGENATRVVPARVRLRRQDEEHPEVVERRIEKLLAEHTRDLGRPQELVLDIDEALGLLEGAHVRLEDPEVTARQGVVDLLRDRADDLQLDVTGCLAGRDRWKHLPGDLVPPHPEVLGNVADRRPFDPGRRVVPPHRGAGRMLAQVVPVAGLVREVDPADEGDPVVDDDRLLVVAVKRPLARIELALDPRALCELVSHALDLAPGRAEERERSACPDEDPDVESLGQLREQIAKDKRGSLAHERKVGREVPAGDVHVRARCLQRIGDRRQRFGSVDEDLDRVAGIVEAAHTRPSRHLPGSGRPPSQGRAGAGRGARWSGSRRPGR